MFQVEIYGRVRRAVRVEGRRQRAVARDSGLSRETVRKMLQYAVPPGDQRQRAFSELQSYYLFADKFGRPAKGNDKGKVEGLVGYRFHL